MNGVGKPCAGEPHARFDVAGAGDGATSVGHLRVPGRCAEKRHHYGLVGTQPTDQSLPRQRSTLHTFRGRFAHGRYGHFMCFLPAMSDKARKAIGKKIRDWHLKRRSRTDLSGLAEEINPQVRGWIGYYGAYYRSRLHSLAMRIDGHLVRWAMQKYKRLRGKPRRAHAWLNAVRRREPGLFAHWALVRLTDDRPVGAG
jgi:hypothetical protein